jgi:hypothetical protein
MISGDPLTATLTFVKYENGSFTFTISKAIPSVLWIIISDAKVTGYTEEFCTSFPNQESLLPSAKLYPTVDGASITVKGSPILDSSYTNYEKGTYFKVNGVNVQNGDTIVIGGTTVTIVNIVGCETYISL